MCMRTLRPFVLAAAAIACADVTPGAAAVDGARPPGVATTQDAAAAPRLTLRRLVDPGSRIEVQGRPITFALHGLIRFDTLADLFRYIDAEAGRWTFDSPAERAAFAGRLMRRGVESRIVSMETELPLEVILTHTRGELERAVASLVTADAGMVFTGRHWQLTSDDYRDALLGIRNRWAAGLNCWSASPSIAGRVLSNWYIVDEGIELYGAAYDSTEHFWQAVKYHPDVTTGDLRTLLAAVSAIDWRPWVASLRTVQEFYFANAYAVEFLDQNLTLERLAWFDAELSRVTQPGERARSAQQRMDRPQDGAPRFTSLDEKVLWGDLADVFHLIVTFAGVAGAPADHTIAAVREALVARHFDAIYLAGYSGGRVGFLSREFQALMLEIWKVKFLETPRFAEVMRSTAGLRLDHFLNDGDSPDIPIPVYVGYLSRIREMAMERTR
ncbi:hypothetical protein BH23ACI1_BH23ACI1_26810 [soil metagenome]